MKKLLKLIGIIAIAAVIGFSMAACDDGSGGGGVAPTITTTALQNGTAGTAYSQTLEATGDTPITWSIESGTLPAGLSLAGTGAISGTPATAGTSTFTVKATNAAGNNTKQLSITIGGITGPVVDGNSYAVGDTGPAGGIIFYVSEAGFTTTDDSTTAHYLEAAPSDMATTLAWASILYTNNTGIAGTDTPIGTGRKNTALILATDSNAPAAKACRDYSGGGKGDWFLPSLNELNELYRQRAFFGITTGTYWSSSQYLDSDDAWVQSFAGGQGRHSKDSDNPVRAVRAF